MKTKLVHVNIPFRVVNSLQEKFPAIKVQSTVAVVISKRNPDPWWVCSDHGASRCKTCQQWLTSRDRARTVCKHHRVTGICGVCTKVRNVEYQPSTTKVSSIPGHTRVHITLDGVTCECGWNDLNGYYNAEGNWLGGTTQRRDAILILEHLDEVGLPYHRARLATVLDQAQKSKATKLFEEIIEIGATNLLDQTLIIRNTYRIAAEKGIIPPGV